MFAVLTAGILQYEYTKHIKNKVFDFSDKSVLKNYLFSQYALALIFALLVIPQSYLSNYFITIFGLESGLEHPLNIYDNADMLILMSFTFLVPVFIFPAVNFSKYTKTSVAVFILLVFLFVQMPEFFDFYFSSFEGRDVVYNYILTNSSIIAAVLFFTLIIRYILGVKSKPALLNGWFILVLIMLLFLLFSTIYDVNNLIGYASRNNIKSQRGLEFFQEAYVSSGFLFLYILIMIIALILLRFHTRDKFVQNIIIYVNSSKIILLVSIYILTKILSFTTIDLSNNPLYLAFVFLLLMPYFSIKASMGVLRTQKENAILLQGVFNKFRKVRPSKEAKI